MKPESQRIAIAEACGQKPVWHEHMGTPIPSVGYWHISNVPDYMGDLNAMHEAEEMLVSKGLTQQFYLELIAVTTVDRFFLIHATAAQRAEAFLRSIGKWEDGR